MRSASWYNHVKVVKYFNENMPCIASFLGFTVCRLRNVERLSLFKTFLRYLFCRCIPPTEAQLRLQNRIKRTNDKISRKRRNAAARLIQKAFRHYLQAKNLMASLRLLILAKKLEPFILNYVNNKRARADEVRRLEQLEIRRVRLRVLLDNLLAVKIAQDAKQKFIDNKHEVDRFVIRLQAVARMRSARRAHLRDLLEKANHKRTVLPYTASKLARAPRFRTDAAKILADKVVLLAEGSKPFIKSPYLSFPKGVPTLNQKVFESSWPHIATSNSAYVPVVHVVKLIKDFYLDNGLYNVAVSKDGQLQPSVFDGVWKGEILVYITTKNTPPKLPHPSVKRFRPVNQVAGSSKPSSLGHIMQSELNLAESLSTAGLRVAAKEFKPLIASLEPTRDTTLAAFIDDALSVTSESSSIASTTCGCGDLICLCENETQAYAADNKSQLRSGGRYTKDTYRKCGRCGEGTMDRRIHFLGDVEICSDCVTQIKQNANREKQLSLNKGKDVPIRCTCWRLGSWCRKHHHKTNSATMNCACPNIPGFNA